MIPFLLTLPKGETFHSDNIEFAHKVFKNDFVDNTCYLTVSTNTYPITVKTMEVCVCPFGNGSKEKRFWHLITKKEDDRKKRNNPCPEDTERNRSFCNARAKRIHWVKYLIDNWQSDPEIVHYYQGIDLVIWHKRMDFLIVLKKLTNTLDKFLVTSYLVFRNKRKRYQKEFDKYEREKPNGNEWF